MIQKDTEKHQKNTDKYYCRKCLFSTSHSGLWKRHLKTKKHNDTKMIQNDTLKEHENNLQKLTCECGKTYKYHSGYYRHIKTCPKANSKKKLKEAADLVTCSEENNENYKKGLAEGVDLVTDIMEKLRNKGLLGNENTNITGNNNNINNQKIYNVNLFLNENCANAMSIQDFANKLKITMDDLNENKTDCITNIVLKNLKPMQLTERPFHCTSLENKEWYINDEKIGWQEDNGSNVIKSTEHAINKKWPQEFEKKYPNWENNENEQDKFIKLANNATSQLNEKQTKNILDIVSKKSLLK